MKAFTHLNARTLDEAVAALGRARQEGRTAAVAGGGSDLLGMMKDRLVTPDLVVNLKTVPSLDRVSERGGEVRIGGLITLDALSRDPVIRNGYAVLAEAADQVGTPQIRHAGTLAGNVCQRPWCWYFRNGFPCLKRGGEMCYAAVGENQLHAIFGGGPSFIVHPSDTAPALLALDARFRIVGPRGERVLAADEFFVLPAPDPKRENVLADDEVLAEVVLPGTAAKQRGAYFKVLDREAWTHAVVSVAAVLDMDGDLCRRARVVLGGVAPVPWKLPAVDRLLTGQRLTPELIARAAETAVAGARPLAKNRYKVPLTRAAVSRTLTGLVSRA